ncbi:MAG TPA: bifunctional DNA-formamidopyrimidine glycosylase/DNA-(apurinic or apyrimidinic site) lyase [Acidimicrobiales bacterium]|nr:bifunctional DNA-formamidopyrimidine glycosylase/DNA-(apurinic or apyrimidinic site) lyase [Acidimicrobiales bacterium]
MPELPEVETVKRDVAAVFLGRRLKHITVTGVRTVRRHPPGLLVALEGAKLAKVGRHGKYLLFDWDDGQVMVAHLRMSGQLLAAHPGDPLATHTHAVLSFSGGWDLRFVDPRTFGELFLAGPSTADDAAGSARKQGPHGTHVATNGLSARGEAPLVRELEHLGPDALDVDQPRLQAALSGRRAPLKSLLVDQRALAGIGNIYADEICFDARLRPDRQGGSLGRADVKRLTSSVHTILQAAIVGRGSSLADEQYRDLQGEPGRFQLEHKVYGRLGLPCLRCGRQVQRARFGAKSAYFCSGCQR